MRSTSNKSAAFAVLSDTSASGQCKLKTPCDPPSAEVVPGQTIMDALCCADQTGAGLQDCKTQKMTEYVANATAVLRAFDVAAKADLEAMIGTIESLEGPAAPGFGGSF